MKQNGLQLTALDVHTKEFDTRWRGYDRDQVNEFLDIIVQDYEWVKHELLRLKRLSDGVVRSPGDMELLNKLEELERRVGELERRV